MLLFLYLSATWCIQHTNFSDPYLVICIESDTTTSEAWLHHHCKDSFRGHALSHINNVLLLGNLFGLQVACISTTNNVIADQISHIPKTADIPRVFPSLLQDCIALCGCSQFQPNAKLISAIIDALLAHASPHRVALSRQVLTNPGCSTALPGASACTLKTYALLLSPSRPATMSSPFTLLPSSKRKT